MSSDKQIWKPGTMLNPVPVVMVSCGTFGIKSNIITVAWTGTICTKPPMVSISVRKERFSYDLIRNTGKFVINLVSKELVRAADWCGCRSGRNFDKFAEMKLTAKKAETSDCPVISESPVNIECSVVNVLELGSHDLFIAKIDSVDVADYLIDTDTGALKLERANLAVYCHGYYYEMGQELGKFGYSVKKTVKSISKLSKK